MKHQPVVSSNIESIAHKGTVLHVKFKHGGIYEYMDVSAEQFDSLKGADSCGKYLNGMGIKGRKVTQ